MPLDQKDPHRASGRKHQTSGSPWRIQARLTGQGVAWFVVVLGTEREIFVPEVAGMDQALQSGRSRLGRPACSAGCCIPVLQETSQSRTNRVLL